MAPWLLSVKLSRSSNNIETQIASPTPLKWQVAPGQVTFARHA